MTAGICKRCSRPTGNPDGRQWYCDICRLLVTAQKARTAFQKRLPKLRQPCAMCGGPKGAGERRWYCDSCEPLALERRKQIARENARRWREDPENLEKSRQRDRERTRAMDTDQRRQKGRDWYHRQNALDPEGARQRRLTKNRRARAGRNPDLIAYSDILRGDPCSYCGGRMDLVEHIHTRSTGGTNTWDNVTAGCTSCNGMKRNKSLLHALLHINQ